MFNYQQLLLQVTDWARQYQDILMWVSIVLGLIQCFFGYRMFRLYLFLVGAVIGLVGTGVLVNLLDLEMIWNIVIVVAGIILGGIIFVVLYDLGVFCIGFLFGVGIGILLFPEMQTDIGYFVLGILCGIGALLLKRPVIIVLTTLGGVLMTGQAVAYRLFSEKLIAAAEQTGQMLSTGSDLSAIEDIYAQLLKNPDKEVLALLGGAVLLLIVGIIVQFKTTKSRSKRKAKEQAV
jgi:hypothetical protein